MAVNSSAAIAARILTDFRIPFCGRKEDNANNATAEWKSGFSELRKAFRRRLDYLR
jgi:hypothetical protein